MNRSLEKQLTAQFYSKNRLCFCVGVFSALFSGSMNLILSWITQQLIDTASGVSDALSLQTLVGCSAGLIVLCIGAYLLNYVSQPRFIVRALRQYKDFAFRKLMEKNIATFQEESTAAYLSAFTNDVGSIEENYLAQQFTLLTKAIMFFGAFGMMLWYSPLMTGIAIAITLLPFAASMLTGSKLQVAEKRVSDQNKNFTAAMQDCLSGFTVVKSFKAEREIFRLFAESNRALEGEKFGKRRIKIIVGMIGGITGAIAQLGVFLIGAYLAMTGRGLTPGTVFMFVNLMNFIIEPIAELPGLLASRKAALGLTEKLASALEKNPAASGCEKMEQLRQGISLENVSFGYDEGKEVLHGISTVLEAGKSYAIVGGSGSGKSTLLHLLMAGSTNYAGSIRMDETELRDIAPESLYEMISMIQQNVFVFNASIKENVTMFREFPQKEIEDAMAHAHLTELVAERGEDSLCGEAGQGLSGGEKQRISIARSLLKKSSILLADEVTAALDAQTAYQVTSDILDLQEMTRIVVTHTLEETLLRRYDRILVLKEGRLEESGSFEELMQKKGYFYALYTVAQ